MSKTIIILGINADIGRNIAEQYLKKGFKVVGTYRKLKLKLTSDKVKLFKCDITKSHHIKNFVKNLKKYKIKQDYIFSSIGTTVPISKFFDVNFKDSKNYNIIKITHHI